jgi:hypothetical protein
MGVTEVRIDLDRFAQLRDCLIAFADGIERKSVERANYER